MFSFRIGEIPRTSTHDAPTPPTMHQVPAAVGGGSARVEPGARSPHTFASDGPASAGTGHSVLRLRGGGGSQGKAGMPNDHLSAAGGSSRTYDVAGAMDSHFRHMSDADRAARVKTLEARVDRANSEMAEIAGKQRPVAAQRDWQSTEIERLERDRKDALTSQDSERVGQIDTQLKQLNRARDANVASMMKYQIQTEAASGRYFPARNELGALQRT